MRAWIVASGPDLDLEHTVSMEYLLSMGDVVALPAGRVATVVEVLHTPFDQDHDVVYECSLT